MVSEEIGKPPNNNSTEEEQRLWMWTVWIYNVNDNINKICDVNSRIYTVNVNSNKLYCECEQYVYIVNDNSNIYLYIYFIKPLFNLEKSHWD